jgi:acetyltransferase-like isoleucine patch superfamily enzyme
VGPNCSFFSGTHPLDPFLRNGTKGPELGAPITIGEDCWFGGNATVCPGITIGRGVTVGAGSVVTKDVPDFCVVAGNPARFIRRIAPEAPDPRLIMGEIEDAAEAAGVAGSI